MKIEVRSKENNKNSDIQIEKNSIKSLTNIILRKTFQIKNSNYLNSSFVNNNTTTTTTTTTITTSLIEIYSSLSNKLYRKKKMTIQFIKIPQCLLSFLKQRDKSFE